MFCQVRRVSRIVDESNRGRVESWTATFRVTLESDLSICKLRLSKKSSFIVEFSVVVVGFYALKDIYPETGLR